jgi:hypothetical protein
MSNFTESEIEIFSLDEIKKLGFSYIQGPSIAPDVEAAQGFMVAEPSPAYGVPACAPHADRPEKRSSYGDVVLKTLAGFSNFTNFSPNGEMFDFN